MKFDKFVEQANQRIAVLFPGAALPRVVCNVPPAHVRAHVSLPWAMHAAKILRKPPLEIAKAAAQALDGMEGVVSAQPMPPGYINVEFKRETLFGSFSLLLNPSSSGITETAAAARKKDVLIDFVSANPTGPLHMASGRGAALGDSLIRIFRALGIDAAAEYYVNDFGNQVKLLGASLKARFEEKEPPEDGYQGDYVKDLAKELPPAASGWTEEQFSGFAVTRILGMHQRDMRDFRVNFDRWFRESELHERRLAAETLEKLKKNGKTYEKDGAVWFASTSEETGEDDKDRVLVRKDGSNTYFLNDLAYHNDKLARAEKLINIFGADHHGYVPRMKAGLAAMGFKSENFVVIVHQMVLLNKGGVAVKMSKRSGEFISLRELMDDVGVDACRFFFASRTPDSHLNFDIELAKKRSNENPVFYAQYVHARINSIFRTAAERGMKSEFSGITPPAKLTPQEEALITKLVWFDETLSHCARDLSPHHLTAYLLELAGVFHQFYDNCRVLDEADPSATQTRLFLCAAVAAVMRRGLDLIGVSAPDTM
ncbi:MAG: arginine--tRNA ligase [Elusimicrobiales bacterium]|nr:arginine--tRNA ligase [Elusimicrobiales bacterium]